MINKVVEGQEVTFTNPNGEVSVSGNPLTFNTDSEQVAKNVIINLEPIQAGSGDPSPSNVRTIYGYDRICISYTGLNINGTDTQNGYVSNSYLNSSGEIISSIVCYVSEYSRINPNTNYTVFGIRDINNGSMGFYTEDKTFISAIQYSNNFSIDFKSPSNAAFTRASIRTTEKDRMFLVDNDNGISISTPGTVYGGTLDVESGELVVNRGILIFGNIDWSMSASGSNRYFQYTISNCTTYNHSLCSNYKLQVESISSMDEDSYKISNTGALYVVDNSYTSTTDFKSANTNTKLVYELATPITYQLAPHQVKLLQGANTVTTNGTSIQLTYSNGESAKLSDLSGLADSINSIDKGSISVIGVSSDTFETIENRLYSLIDISKVNTKTVLVRGYAPYPIEVYHLNSINSNGELVFTREGVQVANDYSTSIKLASSGSTYYNCNKSANGIAFSDSTSVTANNEKFTLYY